MNYILLISSIILFAILIFLYANKKISINIFLIYIAILFSSIPLFYSEYIKYGHDLNFHITRLMGLVDSIKNGQFPYRINYLKLNGYGTQDPIFYPYIFLYFPALLNLLFNINIVDSMRIFLFVINIFTAFNMYYCSKKLFKNDNIATISSVLYILSLYRITDIYNRFALGEVLFFAFFPLFILYFYEMLFRDYKKWYLFTISATFIFQSHIISTAILFFMTLIFIIIFIKQFKNKERIFYFLTSSIFTLLINLWFIIPIVYENIFIDYIKPTAYTYENFISASTDLNLFNISSTHYSALGLVFAIVIIISCFIFIYDIFIKKQKFLKLENIFFITGLSFFIISTRFFWYLIPYNLILENVLGKFIQFAFRFLCFSIPFLALSFPVYLFKIYKRKYVSAVIILVLSIFTAFPIIIQDTNNFTFNDKTFRKNINYKFLDYSLTGINRDTDFYNKKFYFSNDIKIQNKKYNKGSISFSYTKSAQSNSESYIIVPCFAYPFFEVYDDNTKINFTKDENALMYIPITKEKGDIIILQKEISAFLLADIISILSLIIFIYLIFKINFVKIKD